MVQRHTIPHLKALIVDKKIPEGKGHGSIMGLPSSLLLKRSIYHNEWAWQANRNATPHLQDLRSLLSDLSNEVLFVYVLFLVLSKIDEIRNQYLWCAIASACICSYTKVSLTQFSTFTGPRCLDGIMHSFCIFCPC